MPVIALESGYGGEIRDRVDAFNGAQLVYVLWARHLMIATPITLPLPPSTRFGDFVHGVLPQTVFAAHPDWAAIDWSQAQWQLHGEPLLPDEDKTLAELGIGHKAFLSLHTPGLDGLRGSAN
jgi:phenol hydroxylase P4 protein